MKVKSASEVAQSCLTLRDPMDCSPPGSSAHGILQARVLEWGAIAPSTRSASFPVEVIILCPNNFSFINLLCKQQSKFSDSDIPCFTPILVIYVLQFLRTIIEKVLVVLGFSGGSDSKRSAYSAGDLGSIPGLGRCPGEKNGNPLQYSCLENPKDRGARWATVHGFEESDTTEPLTLCPFVFVSLCHSCSLSILPVLSKNKPFAPSFFSFYFEISLISVFHYFLPCAGLGFILFLFS